MAAALENSYSYSFEDADQSMSEERKQHDVRDRVPAAAPHSTHSTHRPTEASHHTSSHPGVAAVSSSKIGATDPAAQLRDRARVLNPVRESLAHSLLASQVRTVFCHTAAYLSSCYLQLLRALAFCIFSYGLDESCVGAVQKPAGVPPFAHLRHEHLHRRHAAAAQRSVGRAEHRRVDQC
jgi:hypothetical protein